MIKLLISIFLHFTIANAILNSSQRCDLQNLVKLVKVCHDHDGFMETFAHRHCKFKILSALIQPDGSHIWNLENIFDANSQYDNDSVPALLSTSGDSMISSQYLRVTLKSFLPISKFIIKAVSADDDELKGVNIILIGS